MLNKTVSIILPVLNGQKYIRQCLEAVLAQTERDFELTVVDDGSVDQTRTIIEEFILKLKIENLKFSFFENKKRLGPWGNFEKAVKASEAKYCILLSVDVIIDKDFIKNAIAAMESDETIGCLQAKIFQYELSESRSMNHELRIGKDFENHNSLFFIHNSKLIDTCGFQIHKSRRVTNLGHGIIDGDEPSCAPSELRKSATQFNFNKSCEIFAVEGAVPVFRRSAFLNCSIPLIKNLKLKIKNYDLTAGEIVDSDMFWYGDDFDLGWRMNLFGWKQIFAPNVIAYHDRSTTKGMSYHWWDYFARIKARRQIPMRKRRLDWRNKRLARIKNDQWPNIWRHLPQILLRELSELGYILLVEPAVLLEILKLISLLPKMLRKRKAIMARAKRSSTEMRQWFV